MLKFRKTLINDSGEIRIGITPDNFEAYLDVCPEHPESMFEPDQIFELLDTEGIVYGLDREKILALVQRINKERYPILAEKIAQGQTARPGKDGHIRYNFSIDKEPHLTESDDGHIDYKELGLINNVEKDQLLAEKISPIDPEPGKNIYGEDIRPPRPKEANFIPGPNVRISDDGLTCYAEIDGQVYLKRMMIEVSPIYEVSHDVDLNIGNINFNGSVIVYGNVLSGFTIKARENVTVLGVVEAATIVAGGHIFIKKGIKGGEKANIQCKGDLTVKFIESAHILCQGSVLVETSIINSDVLCYSTIQVARQKGTIVGGHARAVQGIECLEIGSKLGVTTRVTAGDKFLVRERIQECIQKIEELEELLGKINDTLYKVKNPGQLPADKRDQYDRVVSQKTELESQRKDFQTKRNKLASLFHMPTTGRIKVRKICHSNVIICIGHSSMTTKGEYMRTIFEEDPHDKKIRIGSI